MKVILLQLVLLVALQSYGQTPTYKVFLNKEGKTVDSAKAENYALYRLNADSLWVVKGYDMKNNIKSSGFYLDPELSIAHGVFKFYHKPGRNQYTDGTYSTDTLNYLSETGEFDHGLKTGPWVSFFYNNNPSYVRTYNKGILNGPFKSYHSSSNTVLIEGNYINGIQEGEWSIFSTKGKLVSTDIYENGKIIRKTDVASPYVPAKAPQDFDNYLKNKLSTQLVKEYPGRTIGIFVNVAKNGSLSNPDIHLRTRSLSGKPIAATHLDVKFKDSPAKSKIAETVLNSPVLWTPAYDKISKEAIGEYLFFIIDIKETDIDIIYPTGPFDKFTQITN